MERNIPDITRKNIKDRINAAAIAAAFYTIEFGTGILFGGNCYEANTKGE